MDSVTKYKEKLHEGISSSIAKSIVKLLMRPVFRKEYDKLEKELNDPDFKTSLMRYHNTMNDLELYLDSYCKDNPKDRICKDRFKKILLKR